MLKESYIDTQALASHYEEGDRVRKLDPVRGREFPSASEGIVEAVHVGLGFVDVAFPWGSERVSAELLIKVEGDPAVAGDFLSTVTSSVPIHQRVATSYAHRIHWAHEALCQMRWAGIEELDAYAKLSTHKKAAKLDVLDLVASVYGAGKVALYWKDKGRQYVPSKQEIATGDFNCPRCKTCMRTTVYKKSVKLHACPSCLFLIKSSDIVDCSKEPDECGEAEGEPFVGTHQAVRDIL
jgi:hypothetical protein